MKPDVELETLELAKEDGGGRRLAGERERQRLLAAYDASGLTQRGFAHQEGINYFTFSGWLRRRRLEKGHRLARPGEVAGICGSESAEGWVRLRGGDAGWIGRASEPD